MADETDTLRSILNDLECLSVKIKHLHGDIADHYQEQANAWKRERDHVISQRNADRAHHSLESDALETKLAEVTAERDTLLADAAVPKGY